MLREGHRSEWILLWARRLLEFVIHVSGNLQIMQRQRDCMGERMTVYPRKCQWCNARIFSEEHEEKHILREHEGKYRVRRRW